MKLFLRLFFSLIFLLFPLFFVQNIKAEIPNLRVFCPQHVVCGGSGNCSGKGTEVHRVRLSSTESDQAWRKPIVSSKTYIVECFGNDPSNNQPQACTTGNSDLDRTLFGSDFNAVFKNNYNYQFEGMFASDGETPITQPIDTRNGKLSSTEWQSSSRDMSRVFLGLNPINENDIPSCPPDQNLMQCLLRFMETQGVCNSVRWDPYGRVFDSQSLEPITDAKVTLYKKNLRGSYDFFTDPLIPNPIMTKTTGDFNFVVPDGVYRLSVEKNGFNFPFDSSQINRNYKRAYSDIYYATIAAGFKQQDIVQQGRMIHVDIPLDAISAPRVSEPEIVNYYVQADRTRGNYLVIEGRVTHPLTIIKAVNKITNAQLSVTSADKLGNFEIKIDQRTISPLSGCCRLELIKVDLNRIISNNKNGTSKLVSFINNLFSFLQVKAQRTIGHSVDIGPIPSYIQGYAYSGGGKIIPNAKVGVYFTFSNKSLYETTADSAGLFSIGSDHLPALPFELRFTSSSGSVTKKTTSRFITENQSYLTKEKVNIYSLKPGTASSSNISPTSMLNPSVSISSQPDRTNGKITNNQANVINPTVKPQILSYSTNSSLILIVAILLGLTGVVGGILAFYSLKKRR